MKIIEPGHIYELENIDGEGIQRIVFVNRGVRSEKKYEGVLNQEVLRMTIDIMDVLMDRVSYLDEEVESSDNATIIKSLSDAQHKMRVALLAHEIRALKRKHEKGTLKPEELPVGKDGHYILVGQENENQKEDKKEVG